MFSGTDLERVRSVFPTDLSTEQLARLHAILGQLNSPPLATRLRAALRRDEIVLSEEEFDLLLGTRRLRNDLEHGRGVASHRNRDTDRRIRTALSIMNNVLIQRLVRSMRPGVPG